MNTPWEILSGAITRLGDRVDALPTFREATVSQVTPLAVRFDTDTLSTVCQGTLAGGLVLDERVLTMKLRHYVWVVGRKGGLTPWSALKNVPSSFTPSGHTHNFSDVKVDGYADISQWVDQNFANTSGGVIVDGELPPRLRSYGWPVSNLSMDALLETGFYRGSQMSNAPANNQGWWYIAVQGHDSGWTTQTATGYAGADQQIWTRQKNGGAWLPWYRVFAPGATAFAQAAGKVDLTNLGANSSQSLSVSFPSGRFSQPPIVTLQSYTTRYNLQVSDGSVTPTGFSMIASNFSGAGASGPSAFTWTALQMGQNGSAG